MFAEAIPGLAFSVSLVSGVASRLTLDVCNGSPNADGDRRGGPKRVLSRGVDRCFSAVVRRNISLLAKGAPTSDKKVRSESVIRPYA